MSNGTSTPLLRADIDEMRGRCRAAIGRAALEGGPLTPFALDPGGPDGVGDNPMDDQDGGYASTGSVGTMSVNSRTSFGI